MQIVNVTVTKAEQPQWLKQTQLQELIKGWSALVVLTQRDRVTRDVSKNFHLVECWTYLIARGEAKGGFTRWYQAAGETTYSIVNRMHWADTKAVWKFCSPVLNFNYWLTFLCLKLLEPEDAGHREQCYFLSATLEKFQSTSRRAFWRITVNEELRWHF